MPRSSRPKPTWLRNLMDDIRDLEEEAPMSKAEMRAMIDQATAEFIAKKGALRYSLAWLAGHGWNTLQTNCPSCGVIRCDFADVPAGTMALTREQIAARPCACGARLISADAYRSVLRKAFLAG